MSDLKIRMLIAGAVALAMTMAMASGQVFAQNIPGGTINPQRDCQTVRTCRYERGGTYRGCLSSYTCRTCKLVKTRCDIGGRTENCQEMRCTWGG